MACGLNKDEFLEMLWENTNSKERRTVIETLVIIYRKLLTGEEKHKRIKLTNDKFVNQVWKYVDAQQFLLSNGWKIVNDELLFQGDVNLPASMDILLQYRVCLVPNPAEWIEDTKYEGPSEAQLREQELKRKAIEEREKELKEYLQDKKQREELAENVKKEIESDRNRKRIYTKPEAGNVLGKGAKIRTLHPSSSQ